MNDSELLFLHEEEENIDDTEEENDDALGAEDLNLINWDIEEEKYDGKSLIVTDLTEKVGSEVKCAASAGILEGMRTLKKIILILF